MSFSDTIASLRLILREYSEPSFENLSASSEPTSSPSRVMITSSTYRSKRVDPLPELFSNITSIEVILMSEPSASTFSPRTFSSSPSFTFDSTPAEVELIRRSPASPFVENESLSSSESSDESASLHAASYRGPVTGPIIPSTIIPFEAWNDITAVLVIFPKIPSMFDSGLFPSSAKHCCSSIT